ncbi:MAG: cytochrome c oxidase subunit 4 [Thermoleophilaceae bacterium]
MAGEASAAADRGDATPAAGEAIHLPDPSYLPVLVAAGTTIALVGVVLSWVVFGIGMAITVVAVARWIGQTRAEIAELPLEHEH